MTDYKSIFGKPIKTLTTDPTDTGAEGQIWYNSTAAAFKSVVAGAAWVSSAPTINTFQNRSGAGSISAGLVAGGEDAGTTYGTATEEYNGSGWSTGGALNTGRNGVGGFGTLTAAVAFGGQEVPGVGTAVEEYNGTSWTTVNAMSNARGYTTGNGLTQTAGLAVAGNNNTPGGFGQTNVEEYDGTNWTAGGATPAVNRSLVSWGSQTASLMAGGLTNPPASIYSTAYHYDGAAWTATGSLNTARRSGGGSGIQTAGIIFGGVTTPGARTATSEVYNGSTFSNDASLSTGVAGNTSSGIGSGSDNALSVGGYTTTFTAATEEYSRSASVITPGAWAAGGNLLYKRSSMVDGGTQTAAVEGAGGQNGPDTSNTTSSEYNGTTWTSGGSTPAVWKSVTSSTGSQTALISGAGTTGGTTTFEYDGTTWTNGGSLGTGRYRSSVAGIQTAAVLGGGRVSPPALNNTEEYDGSTWTAANAMPYANFNAFGYGIQTAATIVAGQAAPAPAGSPAVVTANVATGNDYDGTNWTTGASAVAVVTSGGGAGIQSNAMLAGGSQNSFCQFWDGTAYRTGPNTALTRGQNAITSERTSAVGSAAMIWGGTTPPTTPQDTNSTEEFTGETSALNFKTLTTS